MKTPFAVFVLLIILIAAAFPAFTSARPYPTQTQSEQQNLDSLLAQTVKSRDVNTVKSLLKRGAYANTLLSEHRAAGSVLHAAAADGNVEMVRALLDHDAEPILRNTHFETAHDLAVKGGFTAIAELLRQAEEGTYKKPTPSMPSETPTPPITVAPAAPAAPRTKITAVKQPISAKKVTAKTSKSQPQKKVAVQMKQKSGSSESAAQRQAKSLKKLNDYNYVKHFSPITGPMYRSTKW